jgi:type VI secretion system secreted protein Hcp
MAVVDYFLKIEDIDGESQDSKHKGEIELDSFAWGESQTGTHSSGGSGAGKVHMQDFRFTMKVNKASPKLLLACANGEHLTKAVLTCRKAGKEQQEYLKFTFSGLLISAFQTTGANGGGVVPMDQVSINYGRIEVEYKEQNAKGQVGGAVKAGWDVKANKPV